MEKGTPVYKVYVCIGSTDPSWWVDEGVVTGIVADGVPLVQMGAAFFPLDGRWHATKAAAKNDALVALIRKAGAIQAKIDTLRDEIAHDLLTTEETAA